MIQPYTYRLMKGIKMNKKVVIFLLCISLVSLTTSFASQVDYTAYNTTVPPTVTDGIKDNAWNSFSWQTVTLSDYYGSKTLDVSFCACHDASMVYFAFEYNDATYGDVNYYDFVAVALDIDEDS